MFYDLILEYSNHVQEFYPLLNMAKRGSAPKSGSSLKSGPSSKSGSSRSGSSPPENASASAGSDGAEPSNLFQPHFEEIYQLFVNERAERKTLQGDFEKSQEDLLKVKKLTQNMQNFVKPHLPNLTNEILMLCKGWNKPNPTKNTFSALTGDRRTHFYSLITLLNHKKAKSNAVLSILSENRPKERAKTLDSINESCNLGIHCDIWREMNQRAAEARRE
jgi:hypothetical protein